MREIKFRAWHKTKKVMEYFKFENIRSNYSDGYWESNYAEGICLTAYCGDNPDVIIMQYTGLKDKNGKEIYEGDILEVAIESKSYKMTGFIKYNKGSYLIDTNQMYLSLKQFDLQKDKIEVIGNKYENPELLEAEQ